MKQIINDKYGEIQIQTINESCSNNKNVLIKECEELYYAQIRLAAQNIKANIKNIKIVLLSGPSASGKTTTSLNIAKYLEDVGVHADVISLDDFYLERKYYPKLENGQPDYESVYALDLDLIRQCFAEILEKQESYFPKYDFYTGQRVIEDRLVRCGENDVLIVEGIHALNPCLTQNITQDSLMKIYASVRTIF
ncbi:MAG: nucleoside kinase, partial [Oscillospiraceae bacterium]